MEFKTIARCDSAYELFDIYAPENLETVSDEMKNALRHVDDFEGFSYTLLNDDLVLIDDGGAIFETCTLDQFWNSSIAYCRELEE